MIVENRSRMKQCCSSQRIFTHFYTQEFLLFSIYIYTWHVIFLYKISFYKMILYKKYIKNWCKSMIILYP